MKNSIRTLLGAVAVAAMAVGCAHYAGVTTLRGSDASTADVAPAELKPFMGKRPGSGQPIARTFGTQPPLIPHAVENFDEITMTDNQCLECHGPATFKKKEAPKVADSHLATAGSLDVRMDRYQCNTCHVAQVDARPLVQNTFVGTPAPVRK